jgi:hypothetical protein
MEREKAQYRLAKRFKQWGAQTVAPPSTARSEPKDDGRNKALNMASRVRGLQELLAEEFCSQLAESPEHRYSASFSISPDLSLPQGEELMDGV